MCVYVYTYVKVNLFLDFILSPWPTCLFLYISYTYLTSLYNSFIMAFISLQIL